MQTYNFYQERHSDLPPPRQEEQHVANLFFLGVPPKRIDITPSIELTRAWQKAQ